MAYPTAPEGFELPRLWGLPDDMKEGVSIHLHGLMNRDAQLFHIDLQEGPEVDPNSDTIAFQIHFDYTQGKVFRNTYDAESKEWGVGETTHSMPINLGSEFDVVIKCQRNSYSVTVNGEAFCEYQHLRDPARVTHVHVNGDVVLRVFEIFTA